MAYRALRNLRMSWPAAEQYWGEAGAPASIHRDAGATIVAVNFLDVCLRIAISKRLSDLRSDEIDALFDEYKPLYTLDSKIHMGLALNIYGQETLKMLEKIKNIRNTFAHSSVRVTFSSPAIVDACAEIKPYRELARLVGRPKMVRTRFLRTTHWLGALIQLRGTTEFLTKPPRQPVIERRRVIWHAPLP